MVLIRELTVNDYDALVALWKETGLPYRPNGRDQRERIAREVAGPCSIFLVAEIERCIVGAVLGTHDGRKGWINRLAVSSRYRRQGIATALVAAVEGPLSGMGIEIVACLIEDWNNDSQTVFEHLGYRYYPDVHYYTKRKDDEV